MSAEDFLREARIALAFLERHADQMMGTCEGRVYMNAIHDCSVNGMLWAEKNYGEHVVA